MCVVASVNKNSVPNAIQHTLFLPQEVVLENILANIEISKFKKPNFTTDHPMNVVFEYGIKNIYVYFTYIEETCKINYIMSCSQ